jgi:uncharacterized protein (UPF0332 family)
MKLENKDDYIKYRFTRSEESFDDALILIANKKWNTAINRLYYSCFYAVIALLLKNDIETRTHNGVRTKLSHEFIKTGKLNKEYGRLFNKLFDYRQKGDYGDLFDFDEEIVLPLVDQVRDFVSRIEKLIDE